ncbi:hypothetical protein RB653_007706 [Dictyostelium firmibasis]|uniref:Uncharacterized protein n=1 Tax=Dictyostelium firmibasis TaxID=79012 RepID=A0AAN7YUW6_9MYCE
MIGLQGELEFEYLKLITSETKIVDLRCGHGWFPPPFSFSKLMKYDNNNNEQMIRFSIQCFCINYYWIWMKSLFISKKDGTLLFTVDSTNHSIDYQRN